MIKLGLICFKIPGATKVPKRSPTQELFKPNLNRGHSKQLAEWTQVLLITYLPSLGLVLHNSDVHVSH